MMISQLSVQRYLDVKSEWTPDQYQTADSSIQFEYDFRVTCDAHYYGKGCANVCRPRDDQFGHYTCSETGSIVCLSGWQGDYCTKRKYFWPNGVILARFLCYNLKLAKSYASTWGCGGGRGEGHVIYSSFSVYFHN